MNFYLTDIIGLAVILITALIGFKKGAISSILGFVGLIASFIIAWYAKSYVYDWLMGFDVVNQFVTSQTAAWIAKNPAMVNWLNISSTQLVAVQGWLTRMGITGVDITSLTGAASGQVQTMLQPVIRTVFELIIFIVLVILINIIVAILKHIGKAVNDVPVLGTVNRIAGFIIGALKGILLDAMIFLVYYYYALMTGNETILSQLANGVLTGIIVNFIK